MPDADARRRAPLETWLAPALVAAVAFVVYLRTLYGGFVWDDHEAVVRNQHVQHPASWLGLLFDRDAVNQFGFVRPLRTLEFAVDRALLGPSAFWFHAHSVAWHMAAATLLFAVLRRLLGNTPAALVAAIAWTVHPAQVETVAWIACRGDVAMAACVFASLFFALKSDGRDRFLAASLVAAGLAPLYKETALALPIAIAALRWTKRARAPVWPYALVAAAYLVYRFAMTSSAPTSHAASFVIGGSLVGTAATMIRGFGFYVAETFVPAQSADWYLSPSTSLADAAALAWLAVHAALLASAFILRRRAPLWTLAVVWFYAFLAPVANWPGFYVGVPTAERYLYVPLAGAALAFGWALTATPRAAWTAALVATAAFAGQAMARCRIWRSDETLWNAVVEDHLSPRGEEFVGSRRRVDAGVVRARIAATPAGEARAAAEKEERELLEDALARYHVAIRAWRDYEGAAHGAHPFVARTEADASYTCGLLARPAEALYHAEAALAVDGALPQAHFDRASALLALGFAPQAMTSMRRATELGLSTPDAAIGSFFFEAASACERQNLLATARSGFESAVETSPPGSVHDAATARLSALRYAGVGDAADAGELGRIAELDAALARVPRTCPAR